MARKAVDLKLEERVGTIRTPVSTPRIPKWLLYSGIGTAAIGALAAGYLGLRSLGIPLPLQPRQAEQWQEQQYNPPQNGSEVTQQISEIENVMSAEQLKATLEEILSYQRNFNPAIEDSWKIVTPEDLAIWKKVEQANKTLYFMLTGRTFEQDKFVTRIVTREEQVPDIHPNLRNPDGTIGVAGTVAYGPNGIIYIYAVGTPTMYASSSRELVLLLANETGQAYDIRLLPINAEVWKVIPLEKRLNEDEGGVYIEAAKHIYQSSVLHLIEELKLKEASMADTQNNREQIEKGVNIELSIDHFTTNGWVFAWWYALNDSQARQELEKNGRLSSATALKLHQKMINDAFNPELKSMIQTSISPETRATLQQLITETVYKRLRSDGLITDVLPGDATYLFVP